MLCARDLICTNILSRLVESKGLPDYNVQLQFVNDEDRIHWIFNKERLGA